MVRLYIKRVMIPGAVVRALPEKGVDPDIIFVQDEQVLHIASHWLVCEPGALACGWEGALGSVATTRVDPQAERDAANIGRGDCHLLTCVRIRVGVTGRTGNAGAHGTRAVVRFVRAVSGSVARYGDVPGFIFLEAGVGHELAAR
jgi:hypothetical protein